MQHREELFKTFVETNKGRIRSVCRSFATDPDDQQDLFQEILINIWKGLESFRGDAQPGTWIYRIAVNTALSFSKKEIKRMQVSVNINEKNFSLLADEIPEDKSSSKEELLASMENQVNQLSIIDKILVTLMLEDLSMREIAEIVGITEPNVRVKIHRIKNELREKMRGKNDENN
jgi:RNA polymerase sigma-70 factor (ECF subfamily)